MINVRMGGVALAAAAGLVLGLPAASSASAGASWVDAWAASPEPANLNVPFLPAVQPFQDQTLRLIVHPEASGNRARIKLSNSFGDRSLLVSSALLARRTSGATIDPASARRLAFGGRPAITIPVGAEVLSDPIEQPVTAGTDLAVDLYLPQSTGAPTWHVDARQTSYTTTGNHVGSAALPSTTPVTSWFFLTDLEVSADRRAAGIVTLGDSITDGTASTVDANRRWPDYLAARLGDGKHSVANEGIAGGRLLHDVVGPNALARFDRDVLSKPSVKYVVSLIGINDIGLPGALGRPAEVVSAQDIEQGYQQLITRAHAKGLRIYGGTLTAVQGSVYSGPTNEAERQQVNGWLRSTAGKLGGFDRIVDFDAATRDPGQPSRLLPTFDSGDHLHPNDAGYQAMADALDPRWFG